MVPIMSLWVPILLSAVLVFFVSAIIHMVLPFHKNDFKKIDKEDEILDAFRKLGLAPGDYMAPSAKLRPEPMPQNSLNSNTSR